MHSAGKIYHRTGAGERALQHGHLGLGAEQWALLALIGRATSTEALLACLGPRHSRADALRSLEALEGWGLVESVREETLRELCALGDAERRGSPARSQRREFAHIPGRNPPLTAKYSFRPKKPPR